jgi:hypothetical protein
VADVAQVPQQDAAGEIGQSLGPRRPLAWLKIIEDVRLVSLERQQRDIQDDLEG